MKYLNRGSMTQEMLNIKLSEFKGKLVNYTSCLADITCSKDSVMEDTKNRQKFLLNVVSALDGYIISTDILTKSQISYTIELGMCVTQAYSGL